jgi:YD repeat-containing protein
LRNGKPISCLAVEKCNDPECILYGSSSAPPLQPYNVVPYTLFSVWSYIGQETVTKYQSNGNIVSTTNYTYDAFIPQNVNGHSLLSKESFTASDGSVIEKRYYYPQDYGSVQNFSTLISKRIINIPIDVRTYNGSTITSGDQYKYNNLGQQTDVYQADIQYGTTDITFDPLNPTTFSARKNMQYNSYNFMKQVTPQDDISTFYLWDSTGKYLMAAIEGGGISWNTVSSYDHFNCSYNSYTLWSLLNSAAPNAKVTTFSYLPLIGVTQSTNPTGIKTNYSYDNFGRLVKTTNDDLNLLKEFQYHYRR